MDAALASFTSLLAAMGLSLVMKSSSLFVCPCLGHESVGANPGRLDLNLGNAMGSTVWLFDI